MPDWQRLYYGVSNPSKYRRIFVNSLAVLFAFAVYGLFTEFVVYTNGALFGLFASAISTALLTYLIWRGVLRGDEAYCDPQQSHEQRSSALTVVPVFLFVIFWLVFSRSIPNLYASALGNEVSAHAYLTKKHGSGRRMCWYRVTGSFVKYPPWHICVSEADFHRLPERGEMRIIGRETIFGLHVAKVTSMNLDQD